MPWAHEMLIVGPNNYFKEISDKSKSSILFVGIQQNGVCNVSTTWESLPTNRILLQDIFTK